MGDKEAAEENVTWRRYAATEQRVLKFDLFRRILASMVSERTMDNFEDEEIPNL